ncbi:MAG: class I SAM-dependent methyltransferase [Verrucomicrobiota bacterium]
MSRISYENYGELASRLMNTTLIAGRYGVQKEAERRIVADVYQKLKLEPRDSLLEIGCNVGNLLVPLSFLVARCSGIDHPACLAKLRTRHPGENLDLIEGNFLDLQITDSFGKLLCYSVLHCIGQGELFPFIDKALALLTPGGRALFGDLPNASLKARFLASNVGKEFEKEWRGMLVKSTSQPSANPPGLEPDPDTASFDDDRLMEIVLRYRNLGFHVYLLPQPPDLPFGNTREDLLIVKPD